MAPGARVNVGLGVMVAGRVGVALGLGVYAASRHGRLGDVGVMAASQLGIAIPNFWFAILLILLFAVQLQWRSEERRGGKEWRSRLSPYH